MRLPSLLFFLFTSCNLLAQDTAAYLLQEVIYSRKDGTALTMNVLTPKNANKAAVVNVVSGNWVSSYAASARKRPASQVYLKRGYTVFEVVHGSQPRFSIADAAADLKRAVQFIRYNAKAYGIEPDRIGITGTSSGGHLSLLTGLADNAGNANAKDPVEKESGKVQAVAVFFPPTDFLNWGTAGVNPASQRAFLQMMGVLGAFTFTEFDSLKRIYVEVADTAAVNRYARRLSPAQLVTPDDPPVYVIHGDADNVVPLQQSQLLKQRMEAIKLPFTLVVKPGGKHGWPDYLKDEEKLADWFDSHLLGKKR